MGNNFVSLNLKSTTNSFNISANATLANKIYDLNLLNYKNVDQIQSDQASPNFTEASLTEEEYSMDELLLEEKEVSVSSQVSNNFSNSFQEQLLNNIDQQIEELEKQEENKKEEIRDKRSEKLKIMFTDFDLNKGDKLNYVDFELDILKGQKDKINEQIRELRNYKKNIINAQIEQDYLELQNNSDFQEQTNNKLTSKEAYTCFIYNCWNSSKYEFSNTEITSSDMEQFLSSIEDIDERNALRSAYEKGYNKYELINSLPDSLLLELHVLYSDAPSYLHTACFMTDEERDIFQYILNTEGEANALKYLSFKEDELNNREGFYKASLFLENIEDSNAVEAFLKTIGKGGVDGVQSFVDGLYSAVFLDDVATAEQYEQMYILYYLTNEQIDSMDFLTEKQKEEFKSIKGLSDKWLLKHTYNISSSIGNMIPSMVASTAASMLLTPAGGSLVGAGLMGVSAGGNASETVYRQGYTYQEARIYGAFIGASEATLQYFLGGIPGLSRLSNLPGWKGFVANLVSEGGEEALQVIADAYIRNAVLGESVNIDWEEVLQSGIYGIITAGVMNGGTIVIDGVSIDVNSISTETSEILANAEKLGITIDYSKINDKTYINSFNQYNNYVALCNKIGITEIVNSETFYSNPEFIDYSYIMKQVKQKLINTNIDTYLSNSQEIIELLNEVALAGSPAELVGIFKELSNSNPKLCDQLLLNSNDIYMQVLTQQLLEPTLDYYSEAVNFANSDNGKEFKTYRTHCETHVKEVAQKSMEAAVAVSAFYKDSNSGTVNLFELYVASIWHDVGMAAGSDDINGINSKYNKRTKEWNPEILKEMDEGNDTRSNHALNSALAILDNSSYFSETLGMDPNIIALSVFAHSKSNSGVTNLTVEADWMRGIKVLDDCYALYNKEFYPNETKKSFIDLCKESGIIEIKNGEISLTEKALKELSGNSFALRLGDANTTTANVETIYNQANQEITYDILKGSGLKLDQFQEIFNGDTVTVHELICIEFGIDYEIVPNKKTGELEVNCISSPNEKVEIQVDGEKISLDQFTVGFILGENNISFKASSTSPVGEADGKLHEICTIKDSNVVMPTIFNIRERLGEVTSGIKKGSGQTASIDIVFPANTSTDVIDMYKEVIRSGYLQVNSVEYNLYIDDSNGNIKKYN